MNENENTLNNQDEPILEPISVTKDVSFTKLDGIVSIASLILGFLLIRFAVVNTTGFITTAIVILTTTLMLIYVAKNGYKLSKRNVLNVGVIYIFSLVYSITANDFIKFLNSIFLILQTTYTAYRLCDENPNSPRFYFYVQMKSLFSYPFANFGSCTKAISNNVLKKDSGKNLKWIIIGLLLTTPVTLLVANLLMSADEGVENILNSFTNKFFNNLNVSLIVQIIFGFLLGCAIFSMMYTNIYKKNFSPYNDTTYTIKFNNYRIFPSIMIYSALTPLCLLYILYVISQIGYFIDAFSGNVHEGYTYSEYARRGFFELTAIACINIMVISIANMLCNRIDNKKPLTLKIYSIMFNVFTLFIISTAMSKMFLYINEYGLTRLRVYTSWFMILLGIVFIVLIIRDFKEFNISKIYRIVFTIAFGLLCFSRVDRIIATTNISLYESGVIQDISISYLRTLSYDAYAPLLDYTIKHDKSNTYYEIVYDDLLKNYYDRLNISSIEFMQVYDSVMEAD